MKSTLFLLIITILLSCNTSSSDSSSFDINAAVNQPDFEKNMDEWFVQFNEIQDKGHNYQEAHSKAIKIAFEKDEN